MDAGVCTACQTPLGFISLEGMLGLFPRARCNACGLVNVLIDGPAVRSVAPPPPPRETVASMENPLYQPEPPPVYEEPEPEPAPAEETVPPYEEQPPSFESPGEYEQPASLESDGQDYEEAPPESTRINIEAPEGEEE